ncbi:MAG: glycosyl hydrolase 115 family protein [Bacteroidota bacterium]|nr:glycosyl hydrolase 115 family protein [Bacteroidota bacterium]
MYKGIVLPFLIAVYCGISAQAQPLITDKARPGSLAIVSPNDNAIIYADVADFVLVQKSASWLQQDMESVTGKKPTIVSSLPASGKNIILIGTLEKSSLVRELVKQKKISVDNIKGKWEAYLIQTVAHPFKGIANALVIAGSDRRGVAYGVAELSQQIGVSPWYWWADVPVKKKQAIYIKNGIKLTDAPRVKYRGIFINDEAPAFSGWAKEKFGGINHLVYEKMFELILRLKGNYLWPAMWGNAFNDDDTLDAKLADEYGIVMGTSHHEPMLRAQQEWKRYGKGKWDYDSNEAVLKDFWRKGIQNMGTHESIVTVGMRGDGDKPMTQGTATALLERIVKDQRQIIEEVTHQPASRTPQLWALYKEVQDYYDKGMRVPDDVTLLLCDDNWGNIRKLPKLEEKPRAGGYGIYYHFDYVGGPRNYKWLNTNPIPRTWEQMHLAYEYNVRQIWIVNVGDLKPMEFPISFFLDYAWNPDKIGPADLQKYTEQWAADQFGDQYAVEIADIISKYTKYNGRRKPELLDANTYSLLNYDEATRVTNDWFDLLTKAEKINNELPAEYRDAYFELVLHPVRACANLQELYTTVAKNHYEVLNKSPFANEHAELAKQLYAKDSLISAAYNHIANGKWNHMMDQTHIGYTYWQQPPRQRMPEVKYLSADSVIDRLKENLLTQSAEQLIPKERTGNVFYERDGYVAIESDHYTKAVNANSITWKVLPDHGRTGSSITVFPVTAAEQKPDAHSPHLEYEVYVYDTGKIKLNAYFSPTLNFHNDDGLKYAISIDDEQPQTLSINKEDNNVRTWEGWVANNIIIKTTNHNISKTGKHIIKFWMVSPCVVLQKLVVDLGGMKPSYLGPPETRVNHK